jgi:uncharacterized phage-associated protein
LYLLDFEHFRQTGKSVTGIDYQAWKFGPVPVWLMEEWEDLTGDLAAAVHISQEKVIDHVRQTVVVNDGVQFDDEQFTPRQLRIMQGVAEQFHDTRAPAMIDVTHMQNGAWDKVWRDGKGAFAPIPYELAIPEDDANRAALLEIAHEQRMYGAAQQVDTENSPALFTPFGQYSLACFAQIGQ